jgi:hypothetical protein
MKTKTNNAKSVGARIFASKPHPVLRSAAARKNLKIVTINGHRMVTRDLEGGAVAVMGRRRMPGSPDFLDEAATVTINREEGPMLVFDFDTAVDAMDFMAGFDRGKWNA